MLDVIRNEKRKRKYYSNKPIITPLPSDKLPTTPAGNVDFRALEHMTEKG